MDNKNTKDHQEYQEHKQGKTLKAVVCQIDCVFMKKEQNITRFDKQHLSHLSPADHIDIILFPELAWTGYNFPNFEEAKLMAVEYGKGEEFCYARQLALRTNAYVMFGYIQLAQQGGKTVLYDSAAILERNGNPLTNTRKTHFTPMDKLWGKEWNHFNSIELKNCKGQTLKCGLPICFDLQTFSRENVDYKFAQYAKEQKCEVILFITSWFDMKPEDPDNGKKAQDYWIGRLKPLIDATPKKNVLFLCSDKVGKEKCYALEKDKVVEIQFIGSSCVSSINPSETKGTLERIEERALTVTYHFT